jgi:hypothetical protein
MVNDRFPARSIYGFEMVDAPIEPHFLVIADINRKFTPNQIIRIFGEFTSMQTLPIYRRLLVRNKAAGTTATEPKETTGVARCFFCFA